jgi:hypothetical protein
MEMVQLEKLRVDHALEGGYARSVSEDRLKRLRKSWDIRKVGTLEVVKRQDGSLFLIDGQHRREVAIEQGIETLPAIIHHDLSVEQEADIYLGKADALPQQALSQFAAQLRRGDREALAIKAAVESVGLKVGLDYRQAHADDGTVIAINRLERIHQHGGGAGLRETLLLAKDAFGLDHRAYQQAMLEATFQFYAAYHTSYDRERLVSRLQEDGIAKIVQRAYAIRSEGTWPRTVDALVQSMWRTYHEPKLRSHRLPAWTGRRARPTLSDPTRTFASGTRAARVEQARHERAELSVVG